MTKNLGYDLKPLLKTALKFQGTHLTMTIILGQTENR